MIGVISFAVARTQGLIETALQNNAVLRAQCELDLYAVVYKELFAPPAKRAKLCANGTTGYRTESKETYNPNKLCKNPPAHGHIFCPDCRREAGGIA